ncbi:SRPBCC family protein [Tunturiibacter lichenicola]|uniref:SRPBCC family protein n=1 Tax=Tunturiibacter lichenicola TaxID=2051959 RepID=UPI0021B2488B|nr:SRPBCC family protein [Edaphobacter lichenicola]
MRHTYHSEQWLPYSIDLVFAFFANPENLPRLMPPWQKARIEEAVFTAPPTPVGSAPSSRIEGVIAGAGSRITLSFKPLPYAPMRIPWEAEITEFVWNDHFCDDQLRGPFAYWHHCHSLRSETRTNTSGTLLRDEVKYELPLGKLGDLANHLFVTGQLHSTFAYRHKRTDELLSRQAPRS